MKNKQALVLQEQLEKGLKIKKKPLKFNNSFNLFMS